MANKLTDMSKVRKVLKLHNKGKSKSFISKYLSLSRNTVKKYIALYQLLNLSPEDLDKQSDQQLEELFSKNQEDIISPRLKKAYEFFPHMEKQLKRDGVTKYSMWEEYIDKHSDGYRSSQFCEHYNRWSKKVNPVMLMIHKAGDKMYVDYAGKTLQIVDKESGEVTQLQFYVSVLGASQYTYAEASYSQQKEDFIKSTENALLFYNGVPQAIVPDNLKSAVTKSSKYEPTLNETFQDFADHYGTTVLPARAYRPRDKALAEGAVRILYQRIYSVVQKKTYTNIQDLNRNIWALLEEHNKKKLTGRPYSRQHLFNELEKEKLLPLPERRYEIKQFSFATVMQNGHVFLKQDNHYYSVPYQYIRKKVKLVYSNSSVDIYHKYNRIANHIRDKAPYNYTTIKSHLASAHQFLSEWHPQRFIDWGASIDESVKQFIIGLLQNKQHPEQAYKSCMGVLSFDKKAGRERLINACKRALEHQIYNYKIIQKILEKGLDSVKEGDVENNIPEHPNIRGEHYYE